MRHTKKLLGLTAVMALAACTDNGITNPINDAAGTYQLTVYAGKSIPANYVIQPGDPNYPDYPNGATFSVIGGDIVLRTDGTFTETNDYRFTPPSGNPVNTTFISTGTWTINGNIFTLDAPFQNNNSARHAEGTLQLDTINYQETNGAGGFDSFEYRR